MYLAMKDVPELNHLYNCCPPAVGQQVYATAILYNTLRISLSGIIFVGTRVAAPAHHFNRPTQAGADPVPGAAAHRGTPRVKSCAFDWALSITLDDVRRLVRELEPLVFD